MRFCRHVIRWISKPAAILVWVAVGLVVPRPLGAQSTDPTAGLLDAWRAGLSARLDRDLAELSTIPPSRPLPLAPTKQNGDERRISQSDVLPSLTTRRLGPWLPTVAGVLHQHGLPTELAGVAAVESGFDPLALSPKGARGLWQFMPDTARRYGLLVDSRRDERLDPVKSTHAAAKYLKDLHAQFQDWPLTLAAYNAGEGRVERALERLGARDFWTLSRFAALPDETRRYVPAVLARVEASTGPRHSWWLQTPIPNAPEGSTIPLADHTTARAHIVYAAASPAR
jgi:soluble lytic murein transglycosylase-like protein